MASKSISRLQLMLLLVGLLCLGIATYLTMNREDGYDVVFSSYQKLQALGDLPHVSRIEKSDSGTLTIRTEGENSHKVSLESGRQEHVLEEFRFETSTDERSGALIVNNFSIPVVESAPFTLDDFTYSRRELRADQIERMEQLIAEMGVTDQDSSASKIQKIARGIYQQLVPFRGPPSPLMRHLDGFEQYEAALAGKSKVHCANHAEIFAGFATVAGVPTRLVDVGGSYSVVPVAAHAFAESYIEEKNAWAYVDLQLHVAMLSDVNGRPLNGIDVLLRSVHRNWEGLDLVNLDETGKFADYFSLLQHFIPPESTLTYLWGETDRFSFVKRLNRLLIAPQPAFSLVHDGRGTALRLGLTYIGISCMVIFLLLLLISFRKTFRNRKRS